MSGSYESVLADFQSEIISVALEYSGPNVEEVFVYLATERVLFAEIFYRQGGVVLRKSKLSGTDVSVDRQGALLRYIIGQIDRIEDESINRGNSLFTEAKLVYNTSSGSLNSEFHYGPLGLSESEVPSDLADRWFEAQEHTGRRLT